MKIVKRNYAKLIRYDAMKAAIERASTVDEAKDIRDKAVALEAYARQANDPEPLRQVGMIRTRAERKTGQLLKETAALKQRAARGGDKKSNSRQSSLKLADYGIKYDQSSDWQKLADIPEKEFEEALQDNPSTAAILARTQPEKPEKISRPKSRASLNVWGVVMEFQPNLKLDAREVFDGMTETMREGVLRVVPLMIPWLENLVGAGK